MNERYIAHRLVALLDEGAQNIDHRIERRLAASRQRALAVQRATRTRLGLAGVVGGVLDDIGDMARSWVTLIALMILAGSAHYASQAQRLAEIEEVDSALLADDLPIDAYLDRGFDAWLKDLSHD